MLGFIGVGNMGGAILRGVLAAKLVSPSDVVFTRRNDFEAAALTRELKVKRAASNVDLVRQVGNGVVVVAVKPHMMAEVLSDIAGVAAEHNTLIVSVAAGLQLATLAAPLKDGQPIVRVMPNVPAQIRAGMSAICANEHVTHDALEQVEDVFSAVGLTATIPEQDFAAFSAIAGCSPAWTFTYIDRLARGALAAGMKKHDAVRIAAQAVLGSAQLVLNELPEQGPAALVDTVTSPGGTTISGLIAAEKAGFSNSVVAAVEAAIARDREIGKA